MEVGRIAMDFVVGLPKTLRKFDSIWIVVDRLTKPTHLIPVRVDYNAQQLAKVYVKEIVRLHGVPLLIILDRVCGALKERIKLAVKKSSQRVAEQFHEAVLCRTMIENTTILKDRARQR
ncbi:hypothetical protein MTR67_025921 [Solanum verrucosum]|uniref:Integrase catalytic domain-containing protein n=1 Tax=Solanum verrucosum TaxID=315347 RepID=A0AAF0QZK7_SOLVR|nr:hypothetical protein MTR67_025921 [Solanum verrucosum]